MAQASLRMHGAWRGHGHGACMVCVHVHGMDHGVCMLVQVSMQEPPSSFGAFKPVAAPPPPAAGFDANAGGFEL